MLRGRRWWSAFAGLLLLSFLPILLPFLPPFFDAPNHLARAIILSRYDESEFYRSLFVTNWRIIPNLTLDVVLMGLCRVMAPLWALKLYLCLVVALTAGGFAALHRQIHGELTEASLGGFALVYTLSTFMGFLNFTLGVGLLLVFCATYLALRRQTLALRLAAMVPLALLLFFTHFLAFLISLVFAVFIAAKQEMPKGGPRRLHPAWEIGAVALLPLLLYLVSPTRSEGSEFIWRDPLFKLVAVGNLYRSGLLPLDLTIAPLFFAGIGLLVAGSRRRLSPFVVPLVGLMATLFIIAPFGTQTTQVMDTRLPLFVLLTLLLGVPAFMGGAKWAQWGGALLGGAIVLQALGLATAYRAGDGDVRRLVSVYQSLPPQAYIFLIVDPHVGKRENGPYMRQHANSPGLAVMTGERFVSDLFSIPTQQPLLYRPDVRRLQMALPVHDDPRRPVAFIDYIHEQLSVCGRAGVPAYVQYAASPEITPLDVPGASLLWARPGLAVYRLNPASPALGTSQP